MKNLFIALTAIIAFTAFGFTLTSDTEPVSVKPGKYGVCGGDTVNPSIELILRKDSTFRYYSAMYVEGVADCDGKWKVEKNAVVLYDYRCQQNIPDKWKINGDCMKGKMYVPPSGVMVLSVCHLESCAE